MPAELLTPPVLAMSQGEMAAVVIGLLVIGFILLGIEIVILPGFGVPGVLGAVCLVGAGVLAFSYLGLGWALSLSGVALIGSLLIVLLFSKSRSAKGMVLESTLEEAVGIDESEKELIGARGVAQTVLRPTGTGRFNDRRYEVTTDGKFVERGTPIRVTAFELGRIMVEAYDPATDPAETPEDRDETAAPAPVTPTADTTERPHG